MPVPRTRSDSPLAPRPLRPGNLAALGQLAARESALGVRGTARWPADVGELADKIQRERAGGLWPTEGRVRNRDRQILMRGLPPGIQVNMDDPRCS